MALIEIPRGSSIKYELDKATGLLAARSHAVLGGPLSGQLRLHPADAGRGRRPARRAGAVPGGGRTADAGPLAGHRPDDDGRQRQEGPQDPGRGDGRPGVQQLSRGERAARAPPDDAAAVFPGLQDAGGQERRGRRVPGRRVRRTDHRGRARPATANTAATGFTRSRSRVHEMHLSSGLVHCARSCTLLAYGASNHAIPLACAAAS